MMDPAELRRIVERQFRVYEARQEKVRGQVAAHLFYVMFPPAEFDARYAAVRDEILARDPEAIVFLRRDHGEDVLFVAERPPPIQPRVGLHLGLLLATLATTALAGAIAWQGYLHAGDPWRWSVLWDPENLLWGVVTFALPLLLILGIHESAHFYAARRHRLRATLPYFIPAPPLTASDSAPFGAESAVSLLG
jgi:hypothetical protein